MGTTLGPTLCRRTAQQPDVYPLLHSLVEPNFLTSKLKHQPTPHIFNFIFPFFFLGIKQILRLYSTSNHKKIMIKITVIMMMSKITVKRRHYKEDKVHINRDLPSYSWGCELAMESHGNSEIFCNIQGRLLDPCLEDCFGYPPPKVGKR